MEGTRIPATGAITEISASRRPWSEVAVGGGATTVGAVLASTYTDGLLVLHDRPMVVDEPQG